MDKIICMTIDDKGHENQDIEYEIQTYEIKLCNNTKQILRVFKTSSFSLKKT